MKVDYMKPSKWVRIKVQDKTMSTRYPHLASESKMLRLAFKSGR